MANKTNLGVLSWDILEKDVYYEVSRVEIVDCIFNGKGVALLMNDGRQYRLPNSRMKYISYFQTPFYIFAGLKTPNPQTGRLMWEIKCHQYLFTLMGVEFEKNFCSCGIILIQ